MKPIFVVLVLIVGVCYGGDSKVPPKDNTPKVPPIQLNSHDDKAAGNPSTVPAKSTHEGNTTSTLTPISTAPPEPVTTTTPKPEYGVGSWNVTDDKGNVCILLKGEIKVTVWDGLHEKEMANFEVAKNAEHSGNCVDGCIMFKLPSNSSLHLMFAKDNNASSFYIHALKANLSYVTENKTRLHSFENTTLRLYETPLDHSYYCAREAENVINCNKPDLKLILKVSNFQVQAFMNSTSANFGAAVDCESPLTPDIVPIVVGCALALLVIVVLVAYLVSRVRSQSRGYLSM